MHVYRISKSRYIKDLTGSGARLNGGRWNPKGINMIYTSSTKALATVEFLVHIPISIIPKNLSIATIEISDNEIPGELKKLPNNWRQYPAPPKLQDMGREWISSNRSLLLRVPSAVVDDEFNILINPNHPNMRNVKIIKIQLYFFNERLVKFQKSH